MVSSVKTVIFDDAEVVSFPRFTCEELDTFCELYRSEYLVSALKLAKEEQLDVDAIWRLKLSIAVEPIDVNALYTASSSPKWISRYLKASLKKGGIGEEKHEDVLSKISLNDKIGIARNLILDLPEAPKAEKVEEKPVKKGEKGKKEDKVVPLDEAKSVL